MLETHSPNYDGRPCGKSIEFLILHYTGMSSGTAALNRLCDPESKVSSHYLVEVDGTIFRLVADKHRAWHAGQSFWGGNYRLNDTSIGIEIVNPGHEFGLRPFADAQIKAVISLSQHLISTYSIPHAHVLAHSDIAPRRKRDPGEFFPWEFLAAEGVGLWPDAISNRRQGQRPSVIEAQRMLAKWGYSCPETGALDQDTLACISAFQRHYRQTQIDGVFDADCAERLGSLLAMRQTR